jgi:hypothetical protein
MSEKHHIIPVWFFVGLLLFIYGCMIIVSGIAEWPHPPDTVLSSLHAPVWWGALLTIIGAGYILAFRPRK